MNGQVDHGALEEFLRGKGLLGQPPTGSSVIRSLSLPVEKNPLFDKPPPVTQLDRDPASYGALFGKFLQNKGYELKAPAAELIKPLPVTDPRAPSREQVASGIDLLTPGPEIPTPEIPSQEILDRPADYIPPPSWWQQVKDVALLLASKDINTQAIVSRGLLRGLGLGNVDPIKTVEKISGQKGFAEEYDKEERRRLQDIVGYTPSIIKGVRGAAEFVGSLVPFSRILKGASAVTKAASKIPALKALARAEVTGTAIGLASKPEDEGILNRVKQIPADVLFFTAFEGLNLSAQQILKMVRYNRAAKFYKNVDWNAVPDPPGGETYTAKQMRDLFIKFRRNVDPATKLPEGITAEEEKILEFFKETGAWKEAAKQGWIPPEGFSPEFQVPETGIPAGLPRRPRFADIFRRQSFAPFEPGFEPPETRPKQPSRAGAPTPEPPPTAPPPPEPTPSRAQAAPGPRTTARPGSTPRRGVPAVVVDVKPNPDGSWTYNFDIPTPRSAAAAADPLIIEWRPEAKRLPAAKVVPATEKGPVITPEAKAKIQVEGKPRAPKVFKNPLYQAVNLEGGVRPGRKNEDDNYTYLKSIFPFELINNRPETNTLDGLVDSLRTEFPALETTQDLRDLAERMADARERARIEFRRDPNTVDVDDPASLVPPNEYFTAEIDEAILDQIAVGREAELDPGDIARARELISQVDVDLVGELSEEEGIARIKEFMKLRRDLADKEIAAVETEPEFVREVSGDPTKKEPWEMTREEFESAHIFRGVGIENESTVNEFWSYLQKARSFAKGKGVVDPRIRIARKSSVHKEILFDEDEVTTVDALLNKHGEIGTPEKSLEIKPEYEVPKEGIENPHKYLVQQALSSGEQVPPGILSQYPWIYDSFSFCETSGF
ncbi:MAG TPA: hypothetical protein ENI27_09610, partial [bacterium]|nr:hypothetical protein [bacterium]